MTTIPRKIDSLTVIDAVNRALWFLQDALVFLINLPLFLFTIVHDNATRISEVIAAFVFFGVLILALALMAGM